jgi:hypothetical protein
MSHPTIAVTGALLAVLALPAAANAAQLDQPLAPCYATTLDNTGSPIGEAFTLPASGFTPNSAVDIAVDGTVVDEGVLTDANGALPGTTQYAAPYIPSGQRSFTVTITEQGNPANVVTATAKTTALGVSVKPQQAKPSTKVRWKGRGFTASNGPIYAHYVYKGKSRKTVRMAVKPGLCGTFSKKSPQIPVASPGLGKWTVQFDQNKKFKTDDIGTYVRLQIRIFRKFG